VENDEPSIEHSKLLLPAPPFSIPAIEADRTKTIELDDVIPSLATTFPAPSMAETTVVSGASTVPGILVLSLVTILSLPPIDLLVVTF
jgi:hypothetical protein